MQQAREALLALWICFHSCRTMDFPSVVSLLGGPSCSGVWGIGGSTSALNLTWLQSQLSLRRFALLGKLLELP